MSDIYDWSTAGRGQISFLGLWFCIFIGYWLGWGRWAFAAWRKRRAKKPVFYHNSKFDPEILKPRIEMRFNAGQFNAQMERVQQQITERLSHGTHGLKHMVQEMEIKPNPSYKKAVLSSPIVDVITKPPHSRFPEAVAYFLTDDEQEVLADLCTPIHDYLKGLVDE